MRRKCRNEMQRIESLCKYLVKCKKRSRIVSLEECVHQREAILIVKDIEIAEHILILHVGAAEGYRLVKDGKCITHRTVCLVCNHMQRFVVDGYIFAGSHHTEVSHYVLYSDPVEVVCLAT